MSSQKTPNETVPSTSPRYVRWTTAIPTTVGVLLTVAFFAAHQVWATGFFLPDFGLIGAFLLYASILYVLVVLNTTLFGLREDRALILDLFGGVLWTIASVWLFIVYPFNFAHFADIVPWPLTPLVSWITPANARLVCALILVGMVAFIPFFALQLVGARRRLASPR